MLKCVDIFMPPFSQYGVLQQMTRDIHEAFKRKGIQSRLLTADKTNPKPFLEAIFSDKPQCTLSLNGLLPDDQGHFFCDMIKIPHVACLVDSQNQFAALTGSPLSIVTCPDQYACHFFNNLNFSNVLFFPHGVDKNIIPDSNLEKKFDIVFLASCIDYEAIRESWKKKYPKAMQDAMEEAAEIALSDQTTPYVEALFQTLPKHFTESDPLDTKQLQLMQLLDDLEMYIRGKDRVELVKGIRDARVDIFGGSNKSGSWSKYIGKNHPNIHLHEGIPFEEALKVMKQSKILLNSCPWIKYGAHERLFAGIASGALVITSENPYMQERFEDGEDIAFYYHGRWDEVNELANFYLENEEKRDQVVRKGREKVAADHTWDSRVDILIQQLPPILEKIKAESE